MENKTLLPNWLLDYVEKAIEDFVPPLEWDEPVDVKLEVKRLRREAPIAAIPLDSVPGCCGDCACRLDYDRDYFCGANGKDINRNVDKRTRPADCPIVTKE